MSEFSSKLELVLNDKTSGSNEIFHSIIALIKEQPDEFLNRKNYFLNQIQNNLSHFESIQFLCDKLNSVEGKKETIDLLNNLTKDNLSAINKIYSKLKPVLRDNSKIITISNSNTVYQIFKLILTDFVGIEILVCESRPKNEGIILAENLAKCGAKVKLITEAQIGSEIKSCDFAIVGADKILEDGSIINKTGSLTLAICAKNYNIPFYIVADRTKKSSNLTYSSPLSPMSEIYPGDPNLLYVTNYYFEKVDKTYITNLITD